MPGAEPRVEPPADAARKKDDWHTRRPKLRKRLRNGLDRLRFRPHPAPVIVLGNQKSGTSAIAHLLADCAGLTKTIDIAELWPLARGLRAGELDLGSVVARHPRPFSSELIKEPNLTFVYGDLKRVFPAARFLFVNRDPRENLRSFLQRTGVPGDLERYDPAGWDVPESWRGAFDPRAWGSRREHYVELLAERWNLAADVWLEHPDEMQLLRYEDFLADKRGSIEAAARALDLSIERDVSDRVDRAFQPAGKRRDPLDFFGAANLARIEGICAERMRAFGY